MRTQTLVKAFEDVLPESVVVDAEYQYASQKRDYFLVYVNRRCFLARISFQEECEIYNSDNKWVAITSESLNVGFSHNFIGDGETQ